MFTEDEKKYIDRSVLCWLATVSEEGQPNVSPKEIFTYSEDGHLLIAHIASPKSVRNIKKCSAVCMSFVDILVQKGYKMLGNAEIIDRKDERFEETVKPLKILTGEAFPIQAVIQIAVHTVEPIIAPRYRLYPNTTEEAQKERALETYRLV